MKKVLVLLGLTIFSLFLMTGCGSKSKDIDKSIFTMAKIDQGSAAPWEVTIKTWKDYGDQIQIETDAGMIILVPKSKVIFFNGYKLK